jgi:hypothetical protein
MAVSARVDSDTIKPRFLGLARRFIETGFIVPAERVRGLGISGPDGQKKERS